MIFKLLLTYSFSLLFSRLSVFLAGQTLQASDLVFLFLFILWLRSLIKAKRLPQDTGLNKPFLLFIFFCLLSFFNSSNLFISTVELLGLIYLYVMFILVVDIVDNRRKLDVIIKFWIGTLTVVLVLGFVGICISMITRKNSLFCWVYHGNFPYLKNGIVFRVLSIFHNPLALANYLIISLGFAASELLLSKNKRYRFLLKIIISFMFLIMLATVSREILCFIFSAFLIYSYFSNRKDLRFKIIRIPAVSLIIVLFLFITIFCSSFHIRSLKIENFSKETNKELVVNVDYAYREKLAFKVACLEMIRRHPFLGVGLKMYRPYLEKLNSENFFHSINFVPIYYYIKGNQYFTYLPVEDPHNDFLQYFAETGIFGGFAFILFIAAFLYLIFKNLKKRIDDRYFRVRLFCFFASFIGILIESIDLDVFKVRPLWFLMALTMALTMMDKKKLIW